MREFIFFFSTSNIPLPLDTAPFYELVKCLALLLNKSKTRSQTADDEVIKELQSNESTAVCDQRSSPTETPVSSDTHTASNDKQASSHQASSK